ncbi:MAG: hypothetical protein NTV43_01110 [Methylococcales bacterium]|nr:hypothetical protein [Methylococcales bacterium]
MVLLDYRKLLARFILFGILISFYDILLHTVFSILHLSFEWLELVLEKVIEHVFHTNRKDSQVIVFYLLWMLALYGGYRLWLVLPRYYADCKQQFIRAKRQYKAKVGNYWQHQPLFQKLKWLMAFTAGIYCLGFFVIG